MKHHQSKRMRLFAGSLASLLVLVGAFGLTSAAKGSSAEKNRYIGAEACESCHSNEAAGNQYLAWSEEKHADAFELLKSDRAIEVGKEHGAPEPWKAEACLKCHTTGFGADEKQFKKSFTLEEGVSCEECHGPGELHKKTRFRAAAEGDDEEEGFGDEEEVAEYTEIPADELSQHPTKDLCLQCHNTDSPTYKHFCYYLRVDHVRHIDPRKPRTAAQLDELLVCKLGDDCNCTPENCDELCPTPPSKLKK